MLQSNTFHRLAAVAKTMRKAVEVKKRERRHLRKTPNFAINCVWNGDAAEPGDAEVPAADIPVVAAGNPAGAAANPAETATRSRCSQS